MLGFRAAGAAGGASLAAVVGTGGAALVGIGLSLAAMYIYDKYVSPNATTPPSGPPVAQINLDNQSRPLTDIEKANGFTNSNSRGQGVTPPNTSSAYPPLWSSAGSVPVGGYPINGTPVCPYSPGVWATNVAGTSGSGAQYSIFTGAQTAAGSQNTVGYDIAQSTGQQCVIGSTTYNIFVRTGRCGQGYAGVGCTLQNPSNVILPADDTCQILRTGNAFSIDAKDPDCTPQAGKSNPVPVFTQSNGTLSFVSKTDSNGRPSVATASVTNGAASVTVSRPNVTTPTYTNDIITSAAPDATTGAAPTTTTTSTNTAGLGPGSVAVSNTTTTTTSEVTVELPDNLAKSEDIAAVKTAIEGLKETPVNPFNPNPGTVIAPDATDAVKRAIGDGSELPSVFSFSPTLPGSVNAPNIVFNLVGNSVNMDISVWVGYVRNFLGVLLYTVTPFVVFSIVSGRRQED